MVSPPRTETTASFFAFGSFAGRLGFAFGARRFGSRIGLAILSPETSIHVVVEGQRKIGVFALAFLDAELEVAGIPLQIVRGYDTRRRNQPGDFGFGWTLEARSGTYRTNGPAGIGWQIPASGGPFGLPCAAGVETRGHRASVGKGATLFASRGRDRARWGAR